MITLFLKILNMSISASWLVLAVLLLRLVLKKAPKWVNVVLWSVVAFRLICPFTIESPVSLIPDSVGNGTLVAGWMDDYIEEVNIIPDNSVHYDAAVAAGREPISDENGGYYVVTKYDQLGEPATIENTVMPVFAITWTIGVVLLLLYTIVSYLRLHRKVSTAILLRDNIYQSEHIDSPFVLGILKPQIYFPFGMDNQTIDYVIAHEQAHIKRGDHIWKPLGFLLLTIYWFNPLMWLAYLLLCRDIELACDEKVIKELDKEHIADYAQALLVCSVNHKTIAACPIAFGEVGVKERVKAMLHYKKPAFWVIVVSVLACVIVAVCFLTNPETEESSQGDITEPTESIVENTDETVVENVGESTVPSMPETVDESTAESVPESTEEPSIFPYDFGSADLDRDGQNETFRVSEVAVNQIYRLDILKEDGSVLWYTEAALPHVGWDSIFLCTLEDQAYLLRYNPTKFQGECEYYYELFQFENGALVTVESDSVAFSVNPGKRPDEQKLEEIYALSDRVNELLNNSVVLFSTENGALTYGGGPTTDFLETFSPAEYSDG